MWDEETLVRHPKLTAAALVVFGFGFALLAYLGGRTALIPDEKALVAKQGAIAFAETGESGDLVFRFEGSDTRYRYPDWCPNFYQVRDHLVVGQSLTVFTDGSTDIWRVRFKSRDIVTFKQMAKARSGDGNAQVALILAIVVPILTVIGLLDLWRRVRKKGREEEQASKSRLEASLDEQTEITIRNCEKRFRTVCPHYWAKLRPTAVDAERFCNQCQRVVNYCASDAETLEYARAGRRIARERPCKPLDDHLQHEHLPEPYLQVVEWWYREKGIDDALKNIDAQRLCPQCNYPAPDWRSVCRVCGFEFGRVRRSDDTQAD